MKSIKPGINLVCITLTNMKLITHCPSCYRPLKLSYKHEFDDGLILTFYKCGHFSHSTRPARVPLVLSSVDGAKKAYRYQEQGIDFIVNGHEDNPGGFNCIIGDQMRLGKTPQALLALRSSYETRTPALYLVRSANLWQWIRENQTWVNPTPYGIFPIIGSKSFIPPGFQSYVMSMDTFSRPGMVEELLTFGFKLVIVDESHSFKNDDSKRTKALIAFLHEISKAEITHVFPFTCMLCRHSWEETVVEIVTKEKKIVSKTSYCPKCNAYNQHTAQKEKIDLVRKCGVILLSGTSIINSADEYFVPLNIVAPELFPSRHQFRRDWLMQDSKGKWTRVNPYRIDEFKKMLEPFVLRREKEDVYTDCPGRKRMFTVIEISDERIKAAYNKVLDDIEVNINTGKAGFANNIAEITLLRQICGLAKTKWVADFIDVCLEEDPSAKYAIGVHHHSVRDTLSELLKDHGVCKIDGDDNAVEKDRIAHKYFETSPEHILLLGMMAAREGLELVYLDNVIVLERQWASAYEEQFEYRFYNPSKDYLKSRGLNPNKTVNIEYVIAKGTIDEWFYDLVEEKRKIFGETIANSWSVESDSESFRELLQKTVVGRL